MSQVSKQAIIFFKKNYRPKQVIQAGEKKQKRINAQGLPFGTLEYCGLDKNGFFPRKGKVKRGRRYIKKSLPTFSSQGQGGIM